MRASPGEVGVVEPVVAERALRASPSALASLAVGVGSSQASTESLAVQLATLLDGYGAVHEGPDIDVIVGNGRAVVQSVAALSSDLAAVEAAVRAAAGELDDLAVASERLWNEAQSLPLDPLTGSVDPAEASALQRRFDSIRVDEDSLFSGLSATIGATGAGVAPVLDNGAIADVIDRSVVAAHDSTVWFQLATALALLDDFAADGDFDTSAADVAARFARFEAIAAAGIEDPRLAADLASAPSAYVDQLVATAMNPAGEYASIDAVIDAVFTVMRSGTSPEEAGLPPGLFPAAYVELKELQGIENGELRQRLDQESGIVAIPDWLDPFDNAEGRSALEAELAANRASQDDLAQLLGLDGRNDAFTAGAAALAMMGSTTAPEQAWVRWFASELAAKGAGRSASDAGLDSFAPVVASNTDYGLIFYQTLGAAGTARLPDMYSGDRHTYELLADTLAVASTSPEVGFDGADLVQAGISERVIASPLQLLVLSDEIPDRLLVDATAESFRLYEQVVPANQAVNLMGHGPYQGDAFDDANLVMLSEIADREPSVMVDLFDTLGAGDADALLRYDPRFGDPPTAWNNTNSSTTVLTEALWRAADPRQNPDPANADHAAMWLIEGAGTPESGSDLALRRDVGQAVELILIDHYTLLPDANGLDLAAVGIVRPEFDGAFMEHLVGYDLDSKPDQRDDNLAHVNDVIDNATETVFAGGAGDALLTFENGLVRDVVYAALETGDGDPSVITDAAWVGGIEGRIESAATRATIEAAESLDARNDLIHGYVGTAFEIVGGRAAEGVLGELAETVPFEAGLDQGVGALGGLADERGRIFPTDNLEQALTDALGEEAAESQELRLAVITALDSQGRVDWPGDVDLGAMPIGEQVDYLFGNNDYRVEDLRVLDSEGQPIDIDGQPVTLRSWFRVMRDSGDADEDITRLGD